MAPRTRVGLIDSGKTGRVRAENPAFCIPGADLGAVSHASLEAADTCAADNRVPTRYDDPRAILEDNSIEFAARTTAHAGSQG